MVKWVDIEGFVGNGMERDVDLMSSSEGKDSRFLSFDIDEWRLGIE
ncbi:hypothetical protein Lser_V15G44161 [Lactuca serriola]